MNKKKINALEYVDTITKAMKKGLFLTTKCGEKVNSMVIEWGHIGMIWAKPVFIAFVRDCRFTHEMLEQNPEFTINVPIHGYEKNAFVVCGTKSGRDMDKIKEANLTLVESEVISAPAIKEFPLTLECKVIYSQAQEAEKLPEDIRRRFYSVETGDHTAFYGEIVDAYMIEE